MWCRRRRCRLGQSAAHKLCTTVIDVIFMCDMHNITIGIYELMCVHMNEMTKNLANNDDDDDDSSGNSAYILLMYACFMYNETAHGC